VAAEPKDRRRMKAAWNFSTVRKEETMLTSNENNTVYVICIKKEHTNMCTITPV
jgi:hypothetical protein